MFFSEPPSALARFVAPHNFGDCFTAQAVFEPVCSEGEPYGQGLAIALDCRDLVDSIGGQGDP